MGVSVRELYFTRRSAALFCLGFASGLPYITLTSSLGFWLTEARFEPKQIGLISLAAIPYSAKFLWAPLVDNRRPWLPLRWGRRRAWILWAQALLVLAIAATALVGPSGGIDPESARDAAGRSSWNIVWALVAVGCVIGLLSATQDISVDAWRADIATAQTRAAAASASVTGWRIAAAGAGAGAILLASSAGWPLTMVLTALLMLACIGATTMAPDPPQDIAPRRSFTEAVIEPLRALLGRLGGRAMAVALFVVVFKLPDLLALPMLPPFLLRHMEYASHDVAIMRQAVGVGTTIVGALVGAVIVPRLGMFRSLVLFGVLQAVSTGSFCVLALGGIPADHGEGLVHWLAPGTLALLAAVIVEYFCAGLVTAGFVAYLMWLCDRRWSATHFAILTSLMALGAAGAGSAGGWMVDAFIARIGADAGWPWFFGACILAGVPGLLLIRTVTHPSLAGSEDASASVAQAGAE